MTGRGGTRWSGCFFFSSRRRHTRFDCDWSSDVCSSDLVRTQAAITLLFTIDLVIVGTVCGAYEAAVYGVLSRLFAVLRSVLQSLSEASWPIIAQRSQQESNLGQPLLY